MITLRRAKERHCDQRRKREIWLTFCPTDSNDPLGGGLGTLETLSEERLHPVQAPRATRITMPKSSPTRARVRWHTRIRRVARASSRRANSSA